MSDSTKHVWLYSVAGLLVLAAVGLFVVSGSGADRPAMTVYKSAACGCCTEWVEHVEDAGFEVEVVEDENLSLVKAEAGVPGRLHACHTARVGGYTVEGHVPAEDIVRLLEEAPPVAGIGVGGMPKGSPGMPGMPEPYAVEAFTADGQTAVYAEH